MVYWIIHLLHNTEDLGSIRARDIYILARMTTLNDRPPSLCLKDLSSSSSSNSSSSGSTTIG